MLTKRYSNTGPLQPQPDDLSLSSQIINIAAPTSIPGDGNLTLLNFSTVTFDSQNNDFQFADIANNRFIIPIDGRFIISLQYGFVSAPVAPVRASISIDGAPVPIEQGSLQSNTLTIFRTLVAGRLITASMSQGTGADPAIDCGALLSIFRM